MKKTILAPVVASVIASMAAAGAQAAPSMEEMWTIIQQQQAEIERLKSKTTATEQKLEITETKIESTADAVDSVTSGNLAKTAQWASKTTLGGYGEHHFNHFEDKNDQVDAHRFVLFVGHQFNDKVRFFSELEIEHGLSGDNKPGEVELEQAYIEWDYAKNHSAVIGQYLIPVGIINETHEPDTFYGTERNPVEKNIIPATWWETGLMSQGEIMPGLSYNAALHSGLEITDDGKVRGGRQKSAKAVAEDFAFTGRLKYTGIQGLELATTVQYQQDITQGVNAGDNDATLLEAHARYTTGNLTLTGLWAGWDIDGDDFTANGTDQQEGWYVEASYKLTPKLGVFVRNSEYDNAAGNSVDTEIEQVDFGINYWLTENVALKADYSDEKKEGNTDNDSLNLGVGWSF